MSSLPPIPPLLIEPPSLPKDTYDSQAVKKQLDMLNGVSEEFGIVVFMAGSQKEEMEKKYKHKYDKAE